MSPRSGSLREATGDDKGWGPLREGRKHRPQRAATERRRKTLLSVEVLWGVAGTSLQLVVVDRTQEEYEGTWVSGLTWKFTDH